MSPEPHARSLPFFVHFAYGRGSVLWHVDQAASPIGGEGGDGSAQRGLLRVCCLLGFKLFLVLSSYSASKPQTVNKYLYLYLYL